MDNRPVGVYDSGLGGLTVWREIRRQLPEESLVYLGDGKNCPYGARPADEICRLADEMGYVQKERKHSRTAKDERLKIGVVTQLARSSFMQEVNRGIVKAALELKEKGIQLILKEGLSVDEEEQLQAIEELEQEGIRGLAAMPVDSEAVREKLNALIEEKNIPVVTFNSDIVGTRRTCFVGMDNRKSGRTAAGLLGMLTRGIGKILIITGYFSNHVDNQRVDGFVEEAKRLFLIWRSQVFTGALMKQLRWNTL